MDGYFTREERDALCDANGGMISLRLLEVMKKIIRHKTYVISGGLVDEGGLPRHLPMCVNSDDGGPVTNRDEEARMACWCADETCGWNKAFVHQHVITLDDVAGSSPSTSHSTLLIRESTMTRRANGLPT